MLSSRPLTPPCVPFGTRRFNNLSAVPCICVVCHHIPLMQGIRLLMTYAKYGCWIFSNNPFCCSPTPKPDEIIVLSLYPLPLFPLDLPYSSPQPFVKTFHFAFHIRNGIISKPACCISIYSFENILN